MLAGAAGLVRRAEELASTPEASENDRLTSGLFVIMMVAGAAAGAFWGIGYALLGRPLSALFPGSFAVVVALEFVVLVRRRRIDYLPGLFLLLILFLPALLQASLGGYVKGSAVIVWSFNAPLLALVLFGPRAGWQWLAGFVAVVGISAMLEPLLSNSAPALPAAAQTVLFAFNFCGVAAVVTLVLAYFRIQRDEAMARSERLLLNVLPPEIALRLKRDEYPIADRFDEVTILFADLVGFTARSAAEPPEVTVRMLNEFLSAFDGLAHQYGLRPIRTMGDSYMVVGGLPVPRADHAEAIAEMALGMLEEVHALNDRHGWGVRFRIGVNSGPAMAAVVGRHRFTYDVWSDAVNTASRMESSGIPERIQVSEETYHRLCPTYRFEPRGEIEVKGKGAMRTYFLVGRRSAADSQTSGPAQPGARP
jgi:guanylate cyclase